MKKLVALATVAAFAVVPATAGAHSKAKVYRGSFQLVGADGSYTSDSFGKAHLVDGKRNDQLSVHVRNLGSRVKYTFRLQSAATACKQGAAGGTDVPGWKYRRGGVLMTNRHGGANSWARAHGFKVDRTVEYFVGVFDSSNRLVACAQLTKKHKAKKGHDKPAGDDKKDKSHGDDKGNDKPQGDDKSHGNANGKDKDKTQGGDNGQGKDKGRGNDKPHGNGQGHDKGDD